MLPRYEPMTATAWPRPFSDPGWSFEPKMDGVRVVLHCDGDGVVLRTRRGRDATTTYPELASFRHDRPCVLDGEVVALDDSGRPSFELLQQRMNVLHAGRVARKREEVPISYAVFDLLHDGVPLVDLPIEGRRDRLAALDLPPPLVRTEVVPADGLALWQFVVERDLEGMVAKRNGSAYRPGVRSGDWRKVANRHLLRAVVGGYTTGEGGRAASFGSLLLGLWAPGGLRWVGAVGSGFDDATLGDVRTALDAMARDECPFLERPEVAGELRWVEPQLVAAVEYKEFTSAGRLRAPVFKGFTADPVGAVTWDAEGPPGPAAGG